MPPFSESLTRPPFSLGDEHAVLLEEPEPVAQLRGALEVELLARLLHLALEALDHALELLLGREHLGRDVLPLLPGLPRLHVVRLPRRAHLLLERAHDRL